MSVQSYSFDLRDTFFNSAARLPFFADYNKRKTKMLQLQPELLPFLGIYFIDETMGPDGLINQGNTRFSHATRIGFSIMIAMNDEEDAERTIDAGFWALMNGLWTDPCLNNVIDTLNRDTRTQNVQNVVFEGISRGIRRHQFGNPRSDNETPVAELQYDITVAFRTTWTPVITDDLLLVDIRTRMRPGDTQEDIDGRIQVDMPITFQPQ